MSGSDSSDYSPASAKEAGESLYESTADVLLTGVGIIIPFIVTLYILNVALDFVRSALRPVIDLLQWIGLIELIESAGFVLFLIELNVYSMVISFLGELIAVAVLLGVVVVVGSVGQNRHGERVIDFVDLAITSIPGIGTVYKSFRRMGDVMLDQEAENFQEIKLVELLGDDVYVIGFETSRSPDTVTAATGHDEMVTMFIPLAPNPVTGGFLTHVPRDNVYDVDMTIEEGVRSILTSGVATGESAGETTELTMGDLEKITDIDRLQDAISTDETDDDDDSSR
ncbi:Uncharacterized membrane protein [Halopelagius inordinatus]|uniref:Uncharacterized membrane protein n=1 Tax=Halopelagius inordinatus TaxID=553467 RepID=A0A1I2M625_9EURY|nr:DUF502 domain-containing protein [Halopelagius inordinatus]SFF86953.1 Uncharacterized membrane protein [Halopelagius inordinatus]